MKTILQLAKESGRTLLEMFAQIPDSFEAYRSQIREALKNNPPPEVQGANYVYIEGCVGQFPEKVIFEAVTYKDDWSESSRTYYEAKVSPGENGEVVFSDVKEVEAKVAITAKNEMLTLEETAKGANVKMTEFHEQMEASFELEPIDEAMRGKKKRKGKVTTAQKADMKNENGRVYPKAVLKEAVEQATTRIAENGPLLMDSQHRMNGQGESVNDIRETVALIKSISFNEADGTVSLPEIEFIETQAGKDLQAVLEGGAKLQVSQRGYGSSHTVMNPTTQETHEEIDFLRINGFDFVPGGQAGVKDATLEGIPTEGKKPESTPTPEQLNLSEGGNGGGSASTSNGNGNDGNGNGGSQSVVAVLAPEDRELIKKGANASQSVNVLENKLAESQAAVEESKKKQEVAHLETVGTDLIETEVAGLARFNEDQKELIVERIDVKAFYPRISDVYNTDAVATILKPEVAKQAAEVDKVVSASKLQDMGYPVDPDTQLPMQPTQIGGQTRIEVIHENMPDAELHHKVNNHVMDSIKKQGPKDMWVMPESHENMKHLKVIMDRFYAKNYPTLLQESSQSDIGGRIATISAMVIPLAFRLTTAFAVCDMEPMTTRILDKKIKRWDPNPVDEDVVTSYANLDPGEGDGDGTNGAIATSNLSYLNYPIYSTRQALRSRITPEAIATAAGTPMMPLMDTVEGLAQDIVNRIDMMAWWQHIIHGMNQDKGQVTTNETFTQVGSTNTWRSANKAWIPYAWDKNIDGEGNPTSAQFKSLAPASGASAAPTGLGTQGIALTASHASGTDAALLFGTDYTIDHVNGEITLTAAGETKRAGVNSAAAVVGTYSYTNNINTWSQTAPSGSTFLEHLISLRRAIGKARVAVTDRNWMPNFLCVNYDVEDLISQGDRMTHLGGTPADMLDRMNQVLTHGGLQTVRTSAIPSDWAIVAQMGSVCHGIQIPWMFGDILTDWRTGEKYILTEQFSGTDCPVSDKISLVGITA